MAEADGGDKTWGQQNTDGLDAVSGGCEATRRGNSSGKYKNEARMQLTQWAPRLEKDNMHEGPEGKNNQ